MSSRKASRSSELMPTPMRLARTWAAIDDGSVPVKRPTVADRQVHRADGETVD